VIHPEHKPWAFKMPDSLDGIWDAAFNWTGDFVLCLEKVHANVRRDAKGKAITQGVSSSWKFACNFGQLQMACYAANHMTTYGQGVTEVTPQKWQKALGLTFTKAERAGRDSNDIYREKKNRNKSMAAELFPDVKVFHWNADALLIAEYARRTHKGD
jgi:hypothetical protein